MQTHLTAVIVISLARVCEPHANYRHEAMSDRYCISIFTDSGRTDSYGGEYSKRSKRQRHILRRERENGRRLSSGASSKHATAVTANTAQ